MAGIEIIKGMAELQRKIGNDDWKPLTPNETRALYQKTFDTINKGLFNNELPRIQIDFLENPAEEVQKVFGDAAALFFPSYNGKPLIILDLKGDPELGIDTDTIESLFHEMTHYYCHLHGMEDTDGKNREFHNLEFKRAIETHGGECSYMDDIHGYAETKLNNNILWEIYDEI